MKGKGNPYSRTGPHMWRLLLAEREYVPLPFRWHVWHAAVASLPPLAAWLWFASVRREMRAEDPGAPEETHAARLAAAERRLAELQTELARLRETEQTHETPKVVENKT